jgi:hypothetical protein
MAASCTGQEEMLETEDVEQESYRNMFRHVTELRGVLSLLGKIRPHPTKDDV